MITRLSRILEYGIGIATVCVEEVGSKLSRLVSSE